MTGLPKNDDVLGDTLRALRIHGTVLLRETYAPPFNVAVPPAEDLAPILGVGPGASVVAFHLAELGGFEVRRPGRATLVIESGEVALCFGGEGHCLGRGEPAPEVDFASLLSSDAADAFGPIPRGRADHSRILCGALILRHGQLNPLVAALPEIVHIRPGAAAGTGRLRQVTALLSAELERKDPAADYVIERLLEVLCAEGIRRCAAQRRGAVGWFRGLADDRVSRSLAAFHGEPGRPWSILQLARVANLSPSRFAARFTAATGTSAMSYVARWRMNLAMRELADTDDGIAAIAARVGYHSLPAFSRAFKKLVGLPPAAYRSQPATEA